MAYQKIIRYDDDRRQNLRCNLTGELKTLKNFTLVLNTLILNCQVKKMLIHSSPAIPLQLGIGNPF